MKFSRENKKKVMGILLGIGCLLLIAICGKTYQQVQEEKQVPPPVARTLKNVWITESTDQGVTLFNGDYATYPWEEGVAADSLFVREQLADVTLIDEKITAITLKREQVVSGKVLGVEKNVGVELENMGFLPFAEDVKLYRLYDTLSLAFWEEILIGYQFCDFVLEKGEICGVLVTREEAMEYIRVQIKTSDYAGFMHDQVVFTGDSDFLIRYGTENNMMEETHQAGEKIRIQGDSPYFIGKRIYIIPTVLTGRISLQSVERSQGTPSYRGCLELVQTGEGIVVINELLLEEYLYSVVPSEMPASYPLEALKAQAICARTYAYGHMKKPSNALYGAHVDDSASYQVYHNIGEQENTTRAVKETKGKLLYVGDELGETYYYSTSCGFGTTSNVWKNSSGWYLPYLPAKAIGEGYGASFLSDYSGESLQEEDTFATYISEKKEQDYEVDNPWYRWTYQVTTIDSQKIAQKLASRYQVNGNLILTKNTAGEFVSLPIVDFTEIKEVVVTKRGPGGVAEELEISTDTAVFQVVTEYNIRYVLCDGTTNVLRQDGTESKMGTLLPSGFFVITTSKEGENVVGYKVVGGGFGHGVGMSQNAAKSMAERGKCGEEILQFFYQGSEIGQIY